MTGGLHRRALGFEFAVTGELDADLDAYFATFDATKPTAAQHRETALRFCQAGDDFFELSIDGATGFRTLDLGVLVHQTVWEITAPSGRIGVERHRAPCRSRRVRRNADRGVGPVGRRQEHLDSRTRRAWCPVPHRRGGGRRSRWSTRRRHPPADSVERDVARSARARRRRAAPAPGPQWVPRPSTRRATTRPGRLRGRSSRADRHPRRTWEPARDSADTSIGTRRMAAPRELRRAGPVASRPRHDQGTVNSMPVCSAAWRVGGRARGRRVKSGTQALVPLRGPPRLRSVCPSASRAKARRCSWERRKRQECHGGRHCGGVLWRAQWCGPHR